MKKTKLFTASTILTMLLLAAPASASTTSFNLIDYFKQKYTELMQSGNGSTLDSGTRRPDKRSSVAKNSGEQLNTGPLMTQRSGTKRPDK